MQLLQQLSEFAINHWPLVLALVAICGLLAYNLLAGAGAGAIDPRQAIDLINHKEAVVLDVRPLADFTQGHIIGAINIPMNGLAKQMEQLRKYKDRPVIVSCRSGAQSSQACKDLKKQGFEQVYNLSGGILAWQNASLPLTRKK